MAKFENAIRYFNDTIKIDNKHYSAHNALVWPLVLKDQL